MVDERAWVFCVGAVVSPSSGAIPARRGWFAYRLACAPLMWVQGAAQPRRPELSEESCAAPGERHPPEKPTAAGSHLLDSYS